VTRELRLLVNWEPEGIERIASVPGVILKTAADRAETLARIPDIEVAFVGPFDAEILAAAARLRWLHLGSAGVENCLFPELVASPILFTCSKPCFDVTAAEHAMAVMLAVSRRLHLDWRHRPGRPWKWAQAGGVVEGGSLPQELPGRTVGIIGFGGMGQELARRAAAFGMRVVAIARRDRPDPAPAHKLLTLDGLEELLAESDFVVLATPLTPATRGLLGERQFAAMKPGACFVDLSGRPALYDQAAIAAALGAGRLAAASIQIPVPPDDSPLWEVPNLLPSFHRVVSAEELRRCTDLFVENLRRYQAGRELVGTVDRTAGY
jgi:phosphoglycerate dehydrogenase-like enzyme